MVTLEEISDAMLNITVIIFLFTVSVLCIMFLVSTGIKLLL